MGVGNGSALTLNLVMIISRSGQPSRSQKAATVSANLPGRQGLSRSDSTTEVGSIHKPAAYSPVDCQNLHTKDNGLTVAYLLFCR